MNTQGGLVHISSVARPFLVALKRRMEAMEQAQEMETTPSEAPGQPGKPRLPEVNEAEVVGRIVNIPKLRTVGEPGEEVKMARFTLAVNRSFRDSSGKRQVETAFVPIVAWRDRAEQFANVGKGSALRVAGRIKTWDMEGKSYRWEIQAETVQVIERRGIAAWAPPLPEPEPEPLPS